MYRMENTNVTRTRKREQVRLPVASGMTFLSGILIGSLVMYLLDPRQGVRRRAFARDRARSISYRTATRIGKAYRHLSNRLFGTFAEISDTLRPEGAVSDRKLAARVRTTIGRSIRRPHKVDIAVHDGMVTLRGDLKPHEAGQLVVAIESVPGVIGVDNQIITAQQIMPQ